MQTQIINFSIPKPLLKALDDLAKNEVKTRSEALRDAIRTYVSQKKGWEDVFLFGKKKSKELKLKPNQIETIIDKYRKRK